MNKKYLLSALFMFLPMTGFAASFEQDIYFGMRNNAEVEKLQQFLTEQGLYTEEITGNFFSITKNAVVLFQEKEGISPAAGYFGPKTRAVVNQKLGTTAAGADRLALIEVLRKRLADLQKELDLLREQQKKESEVPPPAPAPPPSSATTTPPATSPPVTEATTTPLVVAGVKFVGESTTTFPATAVLTAPFKIGDIVIRNDTNEPLLSASLCLISMMR